MQDKELLTKLVAGLKTLTEDQFNYTNFVSEFDSNNNCGTVCCAWGWLPMLVPKSGIKWVIDKDNDEITISLHPSAYALTNQYEFTDIKFRDANFMFYGYSNPYSHAIQITKFGNSMQANIQQVINRIEYIIDYYNTNKLW